MCKTISPFFYYSELKDMNALKVLSDTNNSVYSFVGVSVKCPIYLIIGQDAVNASTHNQPTILQDFLPCVFFVLSNHIEHSIEDVLSPNSVKFLLHNLKIQPLIICIPLALHWTVCSV